MVLVPCLPGCGRERTTVAYRLIHDIMRTLPDPWIDPLDVKVVGLNDSLAEAASAVIRPKVPNSAYPFQMRSPFRG